MSKAKVALAGSVGIASLLTGSAAQVARGQTMTFQQGVNGYTGTFDRKIGATPSNDRNGASVNTNTASFFIDGGASALNDAGNVHGLIRFDNIIGPAAIPSNAVIITASLDMVTTTAANSQSTNGSYTTYRMNTPFDASTTWASLGGDGLYNNVNLLAGSFNKPRISTATEPAPTSARVDDIVQSWVNGSAPNYGFGIRSDNNIDGWSHNTTGAATVANRPKLTVNYSTRPEARRFTYQQNVNGYTGTTDSFINGINGATQGAVVFGSSVEHGFLDGSNAAGANDSFDQPYLARFDNIDLNIPAVTRADLTIHSGFDSDNSGTNGSFSVHRILKPWDLNTSYASLDSDGDTSLTPIAELIANGFIAAAGTETGNVGSSATVNLDVTSIVQAWRDGAPNYGFYIGSTGTADGWEIYSSGAFGAVTDGVEIADVAMQLAPQLSIVYAPPPILYWDTNGVTAGAGGTSPSGNWDGTAANFTGDAAGASASTLAATTALDDVIFSAGTDATGAYTVNVTGTQAAKSVVIARGNVTLAGGSIATNTFDVATGATGTVSSVVTGGATGTLTKTGAGTLTLSAANTYTGGTVVSGGTLVVGHEDAINTGRALTVASGATARAQAGLPKALDVGPVTMAASGATGATVDLTDNAVVVRNANQAAALAGHTAVNALVRNAFNEFQWNQPGVTSSTVAAAVAAGVPAALGILLNNDGGGNPLFYGNGTDLPLFEGRSVDGNSVLVKDTLLGDGDLNGTVDSVDFALFQAGYTGAAPYVGFAFGDYDYNGVIDSVDFGLFQAGYQHSQSNPTPEMVAFAELHHLSLVAAAVPEPTAFGLLALGGAGLLGRRARRGRRS